MTLEKDVWACLLGQHQQCWSERAQELSDTVACGRHWFHPWHNMVPSTARRKPQAEPREAPWHCGMRPNPSNHQRTAAPSCSGEPCSGTMIVSRGKNSGPGEDSGSACVSPGSDPSHPTSTKPLSTAKCDLENREGGKESVIGCLGIHHQAGMSGKYEDRRLLCPPVPAFIPHLSCICPSHSKCIAHRPHRATEPGSPLEGAGIRAIAQKAFALHVAHLFPSLASHRVPKSHQE